MVTILFLTFLTDPVSKKHFQFITGSVKKAPLDVDEWRKSTDAQSLPMAKRLLREEVIICFEVPRIIFLTPSLSKEIRGSLLLYFSRTVY